MIETKYSRQRIMGNPTVRREYQEDQTPIKLCQYETVHCYHSL